MKHSLPGENVAVRASVERDTVRVQTDRPTKNRYSGRLVHEYDYRTKRRHLVKESVWEVSTWEDQDYGRFDDDPKGGWLRLCHTGTGQDTVSESNTRVFMADFKDQQWRTPLGESAEATEGSRPNWIQGRHGYIYITISWYQKCQEVREWLDKLEGYPLADEDDHSALEWEREQEGWEEYGRDDFRREVRKYLEFRLNEMKAHPLVVVEVAEQEEQRINLAERRNEIVDSVMDAITDNDLDRLYQALCEQVRGGERCLWEGESHPSFYTDVVWGVNGSAPWTNYANERRGGPGRNAWNGLLPDESPVKGAPERSIYLFCFSHLPCERCGKIHANKDEIVGIWHINCEALDCDCPETSSTADPVLASLARSALKGEAKALAVLKDAAEERGISIYNLGGLGDEWARKRIRAWIGGFIGSVIIHD